MGRAMTTGVNRIRFTVKPVAAAVALALAPFAAHPDPLLQVPLYGNADLSRWADDFFEAGPVYGDISGDDFKFGQYTSLNGSDAFGIVNLQVGNRDLEDGSYSRLWGTNLGLPSRQAGGEIGKQGKWKFHAEFDQLTHYQTESARFIHDGLGSGFLTLRPGFAGIIAGNSQPPDNADSILPFAQGGYDIKTLPDFFKFGGSYSLDDRWEVTGNYEYQSRSGAKLTGAVIGNGGGNARSMILPTPIDDTTNQFEIALRYTSPATQFSLAYWDSRYSNDIDSLTWQNPFGQVNGWDADVGVGFPAGYGRMSLAPDNDYQQFSATYGHNFTPATRLNATLQYGEGTQDDAFLPYTVNAPSLVNPGLSAPVPLPRESLDGKIDTTLFDLVLTSRLARRFFVKVAYQYNDKDNRTPSDQYIYVAGDSASQPLIPPGLDPDEVASNRIRTNLPPGTTKNKLTVDGDYNLGRGTAIRGWYQYLKTDYQVAAQRSRADTDVNELGIELKSRANELINGNLRYVWAQRRGSGYSTNAPHAASVTPPTLAAGNFDQLPTVRYFFDADYNQDQVKATISLTPDSPFTAQVAANWIDRSFQGPGCGGPNDQLLLNQLPPLAFPAECQGLRESTTQQYTLDGQYDAGEDWDFYTFFSWSQVDQSQAARSFSSTNQGAATIGQAIDPDRNWSADPRSTDDTFGVGANWKPKDASYDAGIQYLYNRGTTEIPVAAGPALAEPEPIPDARATMTSLQVFARWQYSEKLKLQANYWYQHYSSRDWAFDDATPVSSNGVLLTGQLAPRYTANVFGISFVYSGF